MAAKREVEGALSLLVNASRVSPPLRAAVQEVEDEIHRLTAVLVSIRADHQPQWVSEQAKAAGKEPWVCQLCGVEDGSWPCSTRLEIDDALEGGE